MSLRSPPRLDLPTATRIVGAVIICAGLLLAASSPVAAQGYGWFGGLFGGGNPYRQRPPEPMYPYYGGGGGYGPPQDDGYMPRRHIRRHPPAAQSPRPAAPREAAAPPPPAPLPSPPPQKKNASSFVYVFGDTLGQSLANGLDDALLDRQDVAIVHKGRGSSGIVTKDYYDWPKSIDVLLAGKDKIDVAVMMVGSNDHQPIREDGKTLEVGSNEYKAIYRQRVMAIDQAFRRKGVPLIWVGVPITRDSDFADTMATLNDITREAAAKTGATYVDTWDAFSDDNGDFATSGPDVNGQTVRLRSADGILFTRAGARKLAHFVEAHVRRDLDGKATAPVLPTSGAPDAQARGGRATDGKAPGAAGLDGKMSGPQISSAAPSPIKPAIVKPEAGPVVDLNQAPAASNGELAAPTAYRGASESDAGSKGDPQAAPAGRADDARWPDAGPKSP